MSCVTWHLPPPPLGPGAGPTGCLCGCLCTFEKAAWWRKSCDVCLHAWLQCVAPPPLPPTRRFFLPLRRQQHRAASGQRRRGSGSNIRPQEGSGGENEGKRFILII